MCTAQVYITSGKNPEAEGIRFLPQTASDAIKNEVSTSLGRDRMTVYGHELSFQVI